MSASSTAGALGQVLVIERRLIRPYKDQPRKHFNKADLEALKESILEIGQQRAVWVRALSPSEQASDPPYQYELVDGERRYRACGLGNVPTMIAQVRTVDSDHQQFVQSVVGNFGSAGHTPMEIANAIAYLRKEIEKKEGPEKAVVKIAKIFVKTTAWVYQYLSLLRLDPAVQKMMDPSVPERNRLKFQVAVTIASLPPERQVAMAQYITDNSLGIKSALSYARVEAAISPRTTQRGRRRKPDNDYRILFRFAAKLREETDIMLAMSEPVLDAMFKHRPAKHLVDLKESLARRQIDLRRICEALEGVEKRRDAAMSVTFPRSLPKSIN